MENATINFENIEQKLSDVLISDEYKLLCRKVMRAKKIFLVGNGGLHFVASHAATDMTRLIPGKVVQTFDSTGFITSNANDHGYDNIFTKWLESIIPGIEDPDGILIIGLSCSGNSQNVINAMHWAADHDCHRIQISGVKSKKLDDRRVAELVLNCKYFHTVEVLTLMICYDLIMKTGHRCPDIASENTRKGN